jgi:hypothetical protein
MTDRAKQLAAEMRAACSNGNTLDAIALYVAPLFERVERLEAERKPEPPQEPVRPVNCPAKSRGAEVVELRVAILARVPGAWAARTSDDLDKLLAAARRQALDEAEGAVENIVAYGQGAGGALRDAAAAVARLKETRC